MTTLDDIQDLAAALHSRRDTWELVPTLNYLIPHRGVPIEQLWPAAVAWAENPKNRTPASLQYLKIEPSHSPESSSLRNRTSKEQRCYVCGNTRTDCDKLNDFETTRDLPDPHRFESKDEAEHNRSPRQFADALADLDALRKARIDKARDQIRPTKAANAHSLKDRRNPPRRCAGCQGTLAQNEHDRHPGCTPEGAA
jgi:hypothetical protein